MMDLFVRDYYEEDDLGSICDLVGDLLSEGFMKNGDIQYGTSPDSGDSLSLNNDIVGELLCIDTMELGNILALDHGISSHNMNDEQSKASLDWGAECDATDDEVNMLLAGSADFASDSDSKQDIIISDHGQCDPSSVTRFPKKRTRYGSKKKMMKVDWTPELHESFIRAVEKVGVEKAVPSKILEMMGVENLTRHNIASHLQKYRSHKKRVHEAREAKCTLVTSSNRRAEPLARPTTESTKQKAEPMVPISLQYVWGHPFHEHHWPMSWQASDVASVWPVVFARYPVGGLEHMDTWGHPIARPVFYPQPLLKLPLSPVPGLANRATPIVKARAEKSMPDLHPPKGRVDAAIKEVLKNPFTPLPLGLKPPSLESVLFEVQKLGIKTDAISHARSIMLKNPSTIP